MLRPGVSEQSRRVLSLGCNLDEPAGSSAVRPVRDRQIDVGAITVSKSTFSQKLNFIVPGSLVRELVPFVREVPVEREPYNHIEAVSRS
jgi:hypothetical protein